VASGSEGATVVVTTTGNGVIAHTPYRITGYQGAPEVSAAATGTDVNPNPSSLSPSWGTRQVLWIAAEGQVGSNAVNDFPSNYTDGLYDGEPHITGGATVGSARRELTASSEDPGAFTTTAATAWVAATIGIRAPSSGSKQAWIAG
jgi:hypothetical protein